ncbi:MAG: hypothetical protein GEV11_11165 [Streptosporangiales bacterium]|nr:hypothetical protein [Streptosporangiales bacterium]
MGVGEPGAGAVSPPAFRVARRVLGLAVAGTGGLLAVDLGARAFHHYVAPIPAVRWLFNVGAEANLATWWNNTLLLAVAGMAIAAAVLSGRSARPGPVAWLGLAVAAALLSIDETVQLHERLTDVGRAWVRTLAIPFPTYTWVLPGGILAAAATVGAVLWARRFPRDLRYGLLGALAAYLTGALLVESFNGWARRNGLDVIYALGTSLEECLEMSACLLALAVISRYVILEVHPINGRPAARTR